MNNRLLIISLTFVFLASLSLSSQTFQNLDAKLFNSKIKQLSAIQIIDVRTSREFQQGHIANSKNIDISSNSFQNDIGQLNKQKPVFVYCLSGSRSSYAMRVLSSMGFKEAYNLVGGMLSWRAENLAETTVSSATKATAPEITMAQYQSMINTNKLVLVDFYSEYCAPCKKMKPYLEEISNEMKDKVVVIRIDTDVNKTLAKALNVSSLPVLYLYRAKKIVWSNKGYINKDEVVKRIKINGSYS